MADTFRVTARPLSLDAAYRAVRRPDCGGLCLFVGAVRNRNEGRRVLRMRYTAFSAMAKREFRAIAARARARWNLGAFYVAHRTGMLKLGEPSVIVAVSAPHRAEAFAAARFMIDRLKESAPIWKEEFYAGGKAWIATRPCH